MTAALPEQATICCCCFFSDGVHLVPHAWFCMNNYNVLALATSSPWAGFVWPQWDHHRQEEEGDVGIVPERIELKEGSEVVSHPWQGVWDSKLCSWTWRISYLESPGLLLSYLLQSGDIHSDAAERFKEEQWESGKANPCHPPPGTSPYHSLIGLT